MRSERVCTSLLQEEPSGVVETLAAMVVVAETEVTETLHLFAHCSSHSTSTVSRLLLISVCLLMFKQINYILIDRVFLLTQESSIYLVIIDINFS